MAREFSCGHCEFMIRSENEDELVDIVREHARETHDMDMSESDIRNNWQEA